MTPPLDTLRHAPARGSWSLSLWARSLTVLLLLAGLALGLSGCDRMHWPFRELAPARQTDPAWEQTQARQLYQEAWEVVFNEFVDPSYNGQDWYRWKDRYNDKLKTREDAYLAIRTMLASLNDNYTRFLDPRRAQDQNMHIDSRLFGVGIQIARKDNQIVVLSPIEDTPAERAGIKSMDRIMEIDGHSTADMDVDQVADKIRGPKGTPVTLTIQRKEQRFKVRLVREEIVIKTVFGDPISKDLGYIRLSSFISQDAAREMEAKLKSQADTKAMILDVRGNNGGLLPNALDIADMFLKQGQIVSIVDRNGKRRAYRANPAELYNKPLVVLIDEGSASASEILSGALKDNNRATLIGTRTFGKGLVQKINYLQDGSELNLTISKYFTPAGHDIDRKGIAPDITVTMTEQDLEKNRDPQKDAAIAFLKKQAIASKP